MTLRRTESLSVDTPVAHFVAALDSRRQSGYAHDLGALIAPLKRFLSLSTARRPARAPSPACDGFGGLSQGRGRLRGRLRNRCGPSTGAAALAACSRKDQPLQSAARSRRLQGCLSRRGPRMTGAPCSECYPSRSPARRLNPPGWPGSRSAFPGRRQGPREVIERVP